MASEARRQRRPALVRNRRAHPVHPRRGRIVADDAPKGVIRNRRALYRHFSETGELLYVGVSLSLLQRIIGHRGKSHWFDEVSRIEIIRFSDTAEMLAAEKEAIRLENPKYNTSQAYYGYMTIPEAARHVGMSVGWVREKIREGIGPKVLVKGKASSFGRPI